MDVFIYILLIFFASISVKTQQMYLRAGVDITSVPGSMIRTFFTVMLYLSIVGGVVWAALHMSIFWAVGIFFVGPMIFGMFVQPANLMALGLAKPLIDGAVLLLCILLWVVFR